MLSSMIESGLVKPDEKKEFSEYIKYWQKRGVGYQVSALLTPEEREYGKVERAYGEFIGANYTSRAQAEYDLVLENGLEGILDRLNRKYNRVIAAREVETSGPRNILLNKQRLDIQAMMMSAKAIIHFANRYSELARDMAEREDDPIRHEELLEIAERCHYVPAHPARGFKDAIQSYWLCFQVVHMIEYLSHGTSQRLDQTFIKWYRKSVVEEKSLSREDALATMEELLIKIDEMGRPLPTLYRRTLQGTNFMATFTIGGQNIDGTDACNETTSLILDSLADLRISHPDFKFRWHPNVNKEVFSRVLEVISLGIGQPSIKNDDVVIKGLMEHYGYTLEEARSWAVVGCVSPAPTLHWGRARRDAWSVNTTKVLELTFFNGVDPLTGYDFGLHTGEAKDFRTIDDFFKAFTSQFSLLMRRTARVKAISMEVENAICKRPCLSLFFERSLESGRDIMDTFDKSMPWVNDPGIVDTVDSLVGLKYLVYDKKKYSMSDV